MSNVQGMIDYVRKIANDDSHGYSKVHRFPAQGNDFDCSSLMYCAAQLGGGYKIPHGVNTNSGYTGSMIGDFTSAGWTWHPGLDGLSPGCIVLNINSHTEMYVADGRLCGAHYDEFGGSTGPTQGDQTGKEISEGYYYDYPWDGYLKPPSDPADIIFAPSPDPSVDESVEINRLAREVIAGKYGYGQARMTALGDKYEAVQAEVNRLMSGTTPQQTPQAPNQSDKDKIMKLVNECIAGKHGNGQDRKDALGDDYEAVQAEINAYYKRMGWC